MHPAEPGRGHGPSVVPAKGAVISERGANKKAMISLIAVLRLMETCLSGHEELCSLSEDAEERFCSFH